jgi:Mrp family chromosome partitioning ATPase
VLIDAPPALISSDSQVFAEAADSNYLIVRALEVQAPVLVRTNALLEENDVALAGAFLNGFKQTIPDWMYRLL